MSEGGVGVGSGKWSAWSQRNDGEVIVVEVWDCWRKKLRISVSKGGCSVDSLQDVEDFLCSQAERPDSRLMKEGAERERVEKHDSQAAIRHEI
jgi:hypothetical protein